MGFVVRGSDATEAQQGEPQGTGELEEDWYPLYCQALACGVHPEKFGTYTYSQLVALIDAAKLRNLDDRYFSVMDIVGNMTDEGVRDSLHGVKKPGNALRDKLIQKMIRPYLPTFMLPEIAEAKRVTPIEGLSPKAAEGIMQAIERKLIPHEQWLGIVGIWQRILATAKKYRE